MNTETIVFDPTLAELTALVEKTKFIVDFDLEDKEQLATIRASRIELKNTRVKIEKIGKAMREDAVAYQKMVIAKQDELVAIISPEEERLAGLEEEAERQAIKKERLEKLPVRIKRIEDAGLSFFHSENDRLLDMDATQFEAYFNELNATKLQYDKDLAQKERDDATKLLEEENRKIREEQEAKDKELRDREAKIVEERLAIDREKALIEQQRFDDAKRISDEIEAKERLEKQQKEEAEKNEKRKEYTEFLKSHGYTKETAGDFKIEKVEGGFEIYKKVGLFKI